MYTGIFIYWTKRISYIIFSLKGEKCGHIPNKITELTPYHCTCGCHSLISGSAVTTLPYTLVCCNCCNYPVLWCGGSLTSFMAGMSGVGWSQTECVGKLVPLPESRSFLYPLSTLTFATSTKVPMLKTWDGAIAYTEVQTGGTSMLKGDEDTCLVYAMGLGFYPPINLQEFVG